MRLIRNVMSKLTAYKRILPRSSQHHARYSLPPYCPQRTTVSATVLVAPPIDGRSQVTILMVIWHYKAPIFADIADDDDRKKEANCGVDYVSVLRRSEELNS